MHPTPQRPEILLAFGDSLKRERLARGISQEGLAHLAGLDRTYVGGAERGERNVSLVNIVRLAHALEVSLGCLLTKLEK